MGYAGSYAASESYKLVATVARASSV